MGFFSGLKEVIFGAPKLMDNVFDKDGGILVKAGEYVGNLNFTDEERAEHNAKVGDGVRKFAVATMAENTVRSKTRRELALLIMRTYILLIFMTVMTYPFLPEWSAYIRGIIVEPFFAGLVSGVALFFWGTHAYRSKK